MLRLSIFCFALAAFGQPRQVAITIDDLPRGGDLPGGRNLAAIRAMTVKLLAPLRGVPVIGFVNGGRAEALSEADLQTILKIWLNHGATLGNLGTHLRPEPASPTPQKMGSTLERIPAAARMP